MSQLEESQPPRVVGGELTWRYRDPVHQVLGLLLGEAAALQDEVHHPRAAPTLDMESRVEHHAAGWPEPTLYPGIVAGVETQFLRQRFGVACPPLDEAAARGDPRDQVRIGQLERQADLQMMARVGLVKGGDLFGTAGALGEAQ